MIPRSPSRLDSLKALLACAPSTEFTRIMLENFDVRVRDYMETIGRYRPQRDLEPAFACALSTELQRLGLSEDMLAKALAYLRNGRLLQTAPHTACSHGPAFLGATWLTTLITPRDYPCVIGASSSVPFDNDAKSGCLSFSNRFSTRDVVKPTSRWAASLRKADTTRADFVNERRITLIPSKDNKRTVFGSPVSPKTIEILSDLNDNLRPPITITSRDDFPTLALRLCSIFESRALQRPIVFIDLTRVVADYLCKVLENDAHPIFKLLFDGRSLQLLERHLGKISVFCTSGASNAKYTNLVIDEGYLLGESIRIPATPPVIRNHLAAGALCPGLLLTFVATSFINDFCCLGSFNQVSYLERYKAVLGKTGVIPEEQIAHVPTDALTIGRATGLDGGCVHAIDVALGAPLSPNENVSVGEFAASLLERRRWRRTRPAYIAV